MPALKQRAGGVEGTQGPRAGGGHQGCANPAGPSPLAREAAHLGRGRWVLNADPASHLRRNQPGTRGDSPERPAQPVDGTPRGSRHCQLSPSRKQRGVSKRGHGGPASASVLAWPPPSVPRLPPPPSRKDPVTTPHRPGRSRKHLRLRSPNRITPAKSFCLGKPHGHGFWGLGRGRHWGAIFGLPVAVSENGKAINPRSRVPGGRGTQNMCPPWAGRWSARAVPQPVPSLLAGRASWVKCLCFGTRRGRGPAHTLHSRGGDSRRGHRWWLILEDVREAEILVSPDTETRNKHSSLRYICCLDRLLRGNRTFQRRRIRWEVANKEDK